MPLPSLAPYRREKVAAANALEYQKRVLLTGDPEAAAAAVGAPVEALASNEAAQRLAQAVPRVEQELLQSTALVAPALARHALDSREGRIAWLQGVIDGSMKTEGPFGQPRSYSAGDKLRAFMLLQKTCGDYVERHEITHTEEQIITVFQLPTNTRVPDEVIVDMVDDGS